MSKYIPDTIIGFQIKHMMELEISKHNEDFLKSIQIDTQNKILFSVHIHTSQATLYRLTQFYMKYRRQYPFIKYYAFISSNVTGPFPDINVVRTKCHPDQVPGTNGLLCRDIASYEHFLHHPEDGNWLFRAMDDTILNINNLIKTILELNEYYDPAKHVVFRGCMNFVFSSWYLGGGSGWLASRAMIELHEFPKYRFLDHFGSSFLRQDDTTETIIVKMVFDDFEQWSDPRWIEHCCNCNGYKFIKYDFSSIKQCPVEDVYKMKNLISFHPRHEMKNERMIELFDFMPDNLYYFKSIRSDCTYVCFINETSIVGNKTKSSFLKEHVHPFTVDDVIKGKNRINMNDPKYNKYHEQENRNNKILKKYEDELFRLYFIDYIILILRAPIRLVKKIFIH